MISSFGRFSARGVRRPWPDRIFFSKLKKNMNSFMARLIIDVREIFCQGRQNPILRPNKILDLCCV